MNNAVNATSPLFTYNDEALATSKTHIKDWFLNTIDPDVSTQLLESDSFEEWCRRLMALLQHGVYDLKSMLKHWSGSNGLSYGAWDLHSDRWIYNLVHACNRHSHYELANGLIINKWYQRKSPYITQIDVLIEDAPLHYAQVIAQLPYIWETKHSTLLTLLKSGHDIEKTLSFQAKAALILHGIAVEDSVSLRTTHALGELAQHQTECWNAIWSPTLVHSFSHAYPTLTSATAYGWWKSTLRTSHIQGLHDTLEAIELYSPAWWLILATCYIKASCVETNIIQTTHYLTRLYPEHWEQAMHIFTLANSLGVGLQESNMLVFIETYCLQNEASIGSLDLDVFSVHPIKDAHG